jgi:cobalamin synthase
LVVSRFFSAAMCSAFVANQMAIGRLLGHDGDGFGAGDEAGSSSVRI